METSTYAIHLPEEILAAARALARGRRQLAPLRFGTRFLVDAQRKTSDESDRCPRVIIYDLVDGTSSSVWLISEEGDVAIIGSKVGVPPDQGDGIVSIQDPLRQRLSDEVIIRMMTAALKQWRL